MIWIGILFAAGILLEARSERQGKTGREWIVQLSMVAAGLTMTALVQWRIMLPFDPFAWLVLPFRAITEWLYRIL